MAWASIVGHDGVIERFRSSIKRGRLSHAYLFVGPDGVGKELLARELAKALLCAADAGEPCDECPACRKVEHGNHPDLTLIRRAEQRSQLVIDQVREEIQDPIGYKPFEGRYKIFVVADAERMTEEAQNCLLKTLEEPPPHSLLILVATRLEPFVETVVSRCQIVRFRPLAARLVEPILVERHGMEAERAQVLARLSEGSPGRALRYDAEGVHETTLWLLGELSSMPPGGEFVVAAELLQGVRDQGGRLEDARERLRPVLELLALAWRDLFFRASGYSEELLVWGTGCEVLQTMARGLSPPRARRLMELVVEARDHLDANVNIKLLVEKLLLDMAALLPGRELLTVR
jgi:DNA polymerase-3 subunit delta'